MTKKMKSSYDILMASMNAKEKTEYDKELRDLLLSELVLAAMDEDNISVRELAKLAGVSPTIVQEMRSGSKKSFNTNSFFKILKGLGYNFLLERNGQVIPLDLGNISKK